MNRPKRIHIAARPRALGCLAMLAAAACGGKFNIGSSLSPGPMYSGPSSSDIADGSISTGTTTPTAIATHQSQIICIGSDGTRVYWMAWTADLGILRGCDPWNCQGTLVTYATGQNWCNGIAADGADVYWGVNAGGGSPRPVEIRACPAAGCDPTGPRTLGTIGDESKFVTDGAHLYWWEADGTLQRCAVTGCAAPEVVAVLDGTPTSLAVTTTEVYLTLEVIQRSADVGRVVALPKSGGTLRVIADNQHLPTSVSVGARSVYWADWYGNGEVLACPLTGCSAAPASIATGQVHPQSLVVDDRNAYWAHDMTTGWDAAPGSFPYQPFEIVRCPLVGCDTAPSVLATRQPMIVVPSAGSAMVAARDSLFWIAGELPPPGAPPGFDPSGSDDMIGVRKE